MEIKGNAPPLGWLGIFSATFITKSSAGINVRRRLSRLVEHVRAGTLCATMLHVRFFHLKNRRDRSGTTPVFSFEGMPVEEPVLHRCRVAGWAQVPLGYQLVR